MDRHRHILHIDPTAEAERIVNALHHHMRQVFHRRGVLFGVSGSIDPSTTLCLLDRKRQATDFLRIAVYVPHGE